MGSMTVVVHSSKKQKRKQRSKAKAKGKGRGKNRSMNKSTRCRDVPTSVGAYVDLLEEFGFTVVFRRGHYKITHDKVPGVQTALASTPSDWRWSRNSITEIRRVFGIDMRRDDPRTWALSDGR